MTTGDTVNALDQFLSSSPVLGAGPVQHVVAACDLWCDWCHRPIVPNQAMVTYDDELMHRTCAEGLGVVVL